MKFKLFGGLDCPDTLLAQLSVVGNTDIVTPKALAAIVDHVVGVMLLNVTTSPSALGENTAATTMGGPSTALSATNAAETEVKQSTLRLFKDALKPIYTPNGHGSSDRFDGFATKAVAFHESQRLQRAKAAAAAAKKFVVTATADEIDGLSLQPASLQQQLLIAEDALSQALVAIDHIVVNIARYSITDEVLMTEMTMLGMAPEYVDVIKATLRAAIGTFREREESSVSTGKKQKTGAATASSSSSTADATRLAFIFGANHNSDAAADDEGNTATILRQVGLASCPRMGGDSHIGAFIPFTRTSTFDALQQTGLKDTPADTPLAEETKTLAEGVLLNTNEESAQIATTTAVIKLFIANGSIIEMTHAQARTLLNELTVARSIMKGEAGE